MFSDPVDLFNAAAQALRAEAWEAAASLCDPLSLLQFKRQFLESFKSSEAPQVTAEQYRLTDPTMPLEAAEYFAARASRLQEPVDRLKDELPGVASLSALQELSPVGVFTAWLRGRTLRHQVTRLSGWSAYVGRRGEVPELDSISPKLVALGAVSDGPNVAHIVFRRAYLSDQPGTDEDDLVEERELKRDLDGRLYPSVATCRRQSDGGWLLLTNHQFLGLDSVVIRWDFEGSDDVAS